MAIRGQASAKPRPRYSWLGEGGGRQLAGHRRRKGRQRDPGALDGIAQGGQDKVADVANSARVVVVVKKDQAWGSTLVLAAEHGPGARRQRAHPEPTGQALVAAIALMAVTKSAGARNDRSRVGNLGHWSELHRRTPTWLRRGRPRRHMKECRVHYIVLATSTPPRESCLVVGAGPGSVSHYPVR